LRNLYDQNKRYLGGLIEKDEFDSIVNSCSKYTAKVYSENRKIDVEGVSSYVGLGLFITTVMLFTYFFLLFYGIRNDNRKLKIAGYFLLGLSLLITILIAMRNYF
jgi:hypothetical protein